MFKLHLAICLYQRFVLHLLTGTLDDTDDDSGDGLIIVVAVLSVLLIMTIICVVLLVIWIINLNMRIAKMKRSEHF